MRTASYRVSDLQRFVIPLGFVGENEHCQIIFLAEDAYAEYPNAAVSLTVRPPYGEPYPAVVTRDGNNVLWTVKDSDLTRSGQGEIQLSFTTGEVVAKTYVGKTKICRSIMPTGEVPDPIEDFLTEAGAALTAIPETIDQAFDAITAEAQTLEAGESATASFDSETKKLTIGVPEGQQGNPGQDGQDGQDGYTPQRGVDYWTPADQAAMLQDIAQEKADAIAAIENKGTQQVGLVTDEGTTQKAAVQAKGTEVIESIPSDYSELSEDVSGLKSAISYTVIPKLLSGFTEGEYGYGYINSNGQPTNTGNTNYRTTDFIPVEEGNTISYNLIGYSTSVWIITAYDSSKARIANDSVIGSSSPTIGTYTVNEGTAYVRISGAKGSEGFSSTDIWYGYENSKNYIDEKTDPCIRTINNEFGFDGTGWEIGSFNSSTGAEASSITRVRSPYIKVIGGETIKTSGYRKTFDVYKFTSAKAYVSNEGWIDGHNYTVPSTGVGYIRIVARKSTSDETIQSTDIATLAGKFFIQRVLEKEVYSYNQTINNIVENVNGVEEKTDAIATVYVLHDLFGSNATIETAGFPTTVVSSSWNSTTKTATVTMTSAHTSNTSIGVMMSPKLKSGHTYKVTVEYGYAAGTNPITCVRACTSLTAFTNGQVLLNAERREAGDKDVFTFTASADCWIAALQSTVTQGYTVTNTYKFAVYDVTGIEPSKVEDNSLFSSFPDTVNVVTGGIFEDLQAATEEIPSIKSKASYIKEGDYTSKLKLSQSIGFGGMDIGDTVDLTPLDTAGSSHYTLLIDDVVPSERFEIYAVDGSSARPWAFLDEDKKLLLMEADAYAEDIEIVAPSNAKYLVIQVGSAHISKAFVIRKRSISYLSDGKKTGINELNDPTDILNKIENAVSVAKGDRTTAIASRSNLFTLLHFSDVHSEKKSIQRILQFADSYDDYIMDILHSGDGVNTYYGNDNPFSLIGGDRILNVIGNHECWVQGQTWPRPYTATAEQCYDKFIAPFISNWGVTSPGEDLCYYYKDYATAKVRMIVLDCIHYDATQESWFETALSGAKTNGYRVVTVSHYPAMTGLTEFDCTFNTYGETLSPVTPPSGTDQVERLPESAFNCVDTFIGNGGEFVCWLMGHTHADYIGKVTGHLNQIQVIVTTARTNNTNGDAARVYGTKSQDAFNLFIVDGNNKLFKLIRIGADKDRYMRSRQTLCVNYNTKTIVSNT